LKYWIIFRDHMLRG